MERVLDRDAHRFEAEHRLLAELRTDVVGGEVEVAGVVEGLDPFRSAGVEELHLGPDEEGEALLPRPLEVALQHVAGVAVERVARKDLTSQNIRATGASVSPPGSNSKVLGSGLASMSDSWIRL